MTSSTERIKEEISRLSHEEREHLAQYLFHTLDDADSSPENAKFDQELLRRLDDFTSGRDTGEPAQQVMKEIRARYQ